jgi:hypothetical protein
VFGWVNVVRYSQLVWNHYPVLLFSLRKEV